ncbi:MAG TPA: hypothetical protein VMD30_14520 [Tepidisphaeraceae bacterium]|nr:hypothetical protein [Tepidisphaeraceae bacterium]
MNLIHLSFPGGATAPDLKHRPKTIGGQRCVYLWKDIIRVGQYRHPRRRFTVLVDRRRIDQWVRTFRRMTGNGVKVHIPADHSDRAADNRGFVLAMKRSGDRLMALCQFIGEDAARDAARNQVSIGIAPRYVDGQNRHYPDAIVHVALTPVPVVTGQGLFMPVEAAQRAAGPGVLKLAAALSDERSLMATRMLPCDDETLAALHSLVPGLEQAADDQKLPHILQHLQSLNDEEDGSAALSRGEDQPVAHEPPDEPLARAALLEAAKTKRDLCVERGALTPAVADAVLAALSGDVLKLSRHDPSRAERLALSVLTALAENRPGAFGDRTGRQLSPLVRAVPGEDHGKSVPLYEKMAAIADGQLVDL